MPTIDLNADLGEECGDDVAMLDLISSANVACGMHAGNLAVMLDVIDAGMIRGVRLGAHPSYPDRPSFGRRSMGDDLSVERFNQVISAQLKTFNALAHYTAYIKPHGALYNDAATSPLVAALLCDLAWNTPIMHMPGSLIHQRAVQNGQPFIAEVFADRAYMPDGTLAPRSMSGAVLHDPAVIAERVVCMVTEQTVVTIDGSVVEFEAVDSVCVHGDTPGAVAIAMAVREAVEGAGFVVEAPSPRTSGSNR